MSLVLKSRNRNLERLCLFFITIIMALLFWKIYTVLQRDFVDVNSRLANGTMINLNDDRGKERMRILLTRGLYYEDPRDIELIATVFGRAKDSTANMDNSGELNKKNFFVNTDEAYVKGGKSFRRRVELSRNLLGFSESDSLFFDGERSRPLAVAAETNAGLGTSTVSVTIKKNDGSAVAGVLARLQMLAAQDSNYTSEESEDVEEIIQYKDGVRKTFVKDSAKALRLVSFSAYARSDASGVLTFKGLPEGKTYEVLPLQPGYQFGRSQGVEKLDEKADFSFTQSPHAFKLFSTKDFNTLKKEKAFIIRFPEVVNQWFWIIAAVFFSSFILLHIILSVRYPAADQLILPVLMILTGLSFITLFSLQDPLRDRFLAKSTLTYFGAGMAGILLLLFINFRKFTTDSNFYRLLVFKNLRKAANGWPWALVAIGLLILTIIFGTGPEGSGVKVNLFGFQPSELVKYMIILFLAGFFATNEKFISEYPSWNKRLKFFVFAVIAIVTTILLFLILGDLGPAMVCCFTFIILFSFSRGDFMPMVGALVIYAISIWIFKNVWIGTGVAIAALVVYMLIAKKQLSESASMALVVVSGFLLLDKIPALAKIIPGPMERLVDRKAIWQNAWDNQVFGGDQVANGIWAMSGGGITGQGAGEGFAKTIPEAHTDMILPSIGEEFGWAGIISIFILFLIYLHRSIIIGRQTGAPFLFYLCAGIGIGTFVQFLLIAGGSTGALPLSGVALPFISYGGSSLLTNLVVAGFLLSVSRLSGSPAQMKYITNRQDRNLLPALIAACAAIILLGINISRYLFNNKKWVVEPALVADRNGARMYSYNPRISILMNRLQAGNLLDRHGKLLATSDAKQVRNHKDSLLALGIPASDLASFAYKRLDRYYPFGQQMFFWTGDANTGIFGGGTNGYFADYTHAAELRGFPAPETKFEVSANRYRPDRFLPETELEMTVVKRDYSALSELLLAGINSKEVIQFKKRNRDVKLTMDAALQTTIQRSLQADDSVNKKRVSVVVMEDNTGDVIASAGWPLPPVNDWEQMNLSENELNKLPGWNVNSDIGFTHATQPGSTAKLVTALAAFNKIGPTAATKTIRVYPGDLIRVRGPEPDEAGNINIERGIVRSNNSFFIRLANQEKLQEEMATVYMQTGMFLRGGGGYYYENEVNNSGQQERWRDLWRKTEFRSLRRYNPGNIRRTRAIGISGMSWGQGELVATPAAVARLAAGIANNGSLVPNKYVVSVSGVPVAAKPGVPLVVDPASAGHMVDYMKKQSAPKKFRLGILVAGKTGTPERIFKGQRINDGWYVFFAPKATGPGHVVVCVRIEGTKGSSDAVKLAGKHIVPLLIARNYIKSFEPAVKAVSAPAAVADDVETIEVEAVPDEPTDTIE